MQVPNLSRPASTLLTLGLRATSHAVRPWFTAVDKRFGPTVRGHSQCLKQLALCPPIHPSYESETVCFAWEGPLILTLIPARSKLENSIDQSESSTAYQILFNRRLSSSIHNGGTMFEDLHELHVQPRVVGTLRYQNRVLSPGPVAWYNPVKLLINI